jgi:hypothetical protein
MHEEHFYLNAAHLSSFSSYSITFPTFNKDTMRLVYLGNPLCPLPVDQLSKNLYKHYAIGCNPYAMLFSFTTIDGNVVVDA